MDVEILPGSLGSMENNVPAQAGGFTGETEYMKHFTDEDFQYSAAQFDTDYLENMAVRQNSNPSSLSRESLFVKFDPLVGKPAPNQKAPSSQLAQIDESDELLRTPPPLQLAKAGRVNSVMSNDLLVMDTPPKQQLPPTSDHSNQDHVSAPVILNLSDSHMTAPAQGSKKRMYTEDQVTEMLEAVSREEIEIAKKKYAPEIAALEKELADMEQRPGQVYDECMYVDSILSSQQSLLERELAMCKRLMAEHEQLETLMVYCHEKFKEKFLSLAEQRDSTLKSEKFKVKSFDELQQRYLKLQDANKKLYKSQCGLATIKGRSREVTEDLKRACGECLLKQDALNMSCESVQKEVSSKIAVERAQTRTIELQVRSLEKDLEQKEQEKQQLSQIAEELMKELRNSD